MQNRADVVVFDTVRDYYDGDSKEAMIANKVMVEFRKLAERANVAVMLITHTRKAAAGKPDIKIEDVADSRIFTSKADFVFRATARVPRRRNHTGSDYQSENTWRSTITSDTLSS
jgi:RecA-family ATPase